jgi:hypothetical protein
MSKWFAAFVVAILILAPYVLGRYLPHSVRNIFTPMTVTIAADLPLSNTALTVLRGKTFEGGDTPLDGHVYENCKFTANACLIYNGGPYRLESVTFETPPRLCVGTQELRNYGELENALGLIKEGHLREVVPLQK